MTQEKTHKELYDYMISYYMIKSVELHIHSNKEVIQNHSNKKDTQVVEWSGTCSSGDNHSSALHGKCPNKYTGEVQCFHLVPLKSM